MVVLANRLPFDMVKQPDGSTVARQAPGGLVTALAPILARREGAWIGWPGSADTDVEPTTAEGLTLQPVRLSAAEVDEYYEGFSNATLWPLYHDAVAPSVFHRPWWDAYKVVNRRFAERAAEVAAPGATVWIHDYQLQLVPQMLRRLRPDVRIGFFLHIPFPPAELFSRLPWRRQIMAGLLGVEGRKDVVRVGTVGIRHAEQAVVQPELGAQGAPGVHPVNDPSRLQIADVLAQPGRPEAAHLA